MASLRHTFGALIYDWPRFLRAVAARWTLMRNRADTISVDEASGGVRCEWEFSSDLHIAAVHPFTARWLMNRALREWPIGYAQRPRVEGDPRVSFIIGHRGAARVPLLLKTIETIAAQRDVAIECIVVEQSSQKSLELRDWVRYVHTPVAEGTPYNRAATFNAGAKVARAPLIVLHDNDMLVPESYAAELVRRHQAGAEFIDLKRFVFYLSEHKVVQNVHGGSVAADREAYFAIGGFDEEFVGWGGEDNEFWERAMTRPVWNYGYLPMLHLWHESQPEKNQAAAPGIERLRAVSKIPVEERIARLRR